MQLDDLVQRLPDDFRRCYRIDSILGSGSQGVALLANQRGLDRPVVIKLLHLLTPETVKRFLSEAQILARTRHPSIISLYDFGDLSGEHYIVLEFVPGMTLLDWSTRRKPTAREVIDITLDLLSGLHALHSLQITHRDVKPTNIWISQEGPAKLLDLGIARREGFGGVTRTGDFVGTPAYAAPEQFLGTQVDGRADLYSLGLVLIELITGSNPMLAPTLKETAQRQLSARIRSVDQTRLQIPGALENAILCMVQKEPSNRPPDIPALCEMLRSALPGPTSRPVTQVTHLPVMETIALPVGSLLRAPTEPPAATAGARPRGRLLATGLLAAALLFSMRISIPHSSTGEPRAPPEASAASTSRSLSPAERSTCQEILESFATGRALSLQRAGNDVFRLGVSLDVRSLGMVHSELAIQLITHHARVAVYVAELDRRYRVEECALDDLELIGLVRGMRLVLWGRVINQLFLNEGEYPAGFPSRDLEATFRALPRRHDLKSVEYLRGFRVAVSEASRRMEGTGKLPARFADLTRMTFNISRLERLSRWDASASQASRLEVERLEQDLGSEGGSSRLAAIGRRLLLLSWRRGQASQLGQQVEGIRSLYAPLLTELAALGDEATSPDFRAQLQQAIDHPE